MRDLIKEKVREAEQLAARSTDGSATQEGWMCVAQSWRLIGERLIKEPTTEENSTILILH
ncbi:MAG TPA: hypothetical protein VHT03_06195 [Rhizomicrobium sp.]|nr:hypothetical protein [Rhizomicrobium sp.]